MRVGVVGVFIYRFEQFLLGRFLPAFLARGDAKIVVRGRAFRIKAERFGQFGKCVIKLCLPVVNNSQRGVGEFVVGRECDRFFQSQLGGLEFAGSEINDAQIGKRIKIVRRFGQDFLISFFCRPEFALLETLLCLPSEINNVRRNVRLKTARESCSRTMATAVVRRWTWFCQQLARTHHARARYFWRK